MLYYSLYGKRYSFHNIIKAYDVNCTVITKIRIKGRVKLLTK